MPVQRKQDSKGNFYRWGKSGAKYHYTVGDADSRKKAEKKAQKQGAAARASGYK